MSGSRRHDGGGLLGSSSGEGAFRCRRIILSGGIYLIRMINGADFLLRFGGDLARLFGVSACLNRRKNKQRQLLAGRDATQFYGGRAAEGEFCRPEGAIAFRPFI